MIVFEAKRNTEKVHTYVAENMQAGTKAFLYDPPTKRLQNTETIGKLWVPNVLPSDSPTAISALYAFSKLKKNVGQSVPEMPVRKVERKKVECKIVVEDATCTLHANDFIKMSYLDGDILAKVVSCVRRDDRYKLGLEVKIVKFLRKYNRWTKPQVLTASWDLVSDTDAQNYILGNAVPSWGKSCNKMTSYKRDMLYSRPDLKVRGWTEKLNKTFLPAPDSTCTNPYYKKGGNMLFWLRGRIEEIEKTEAWQKARANAHVRQTSASKALATKTAKAVTIAKNLLLTLKIERLSEETIVRRAEAYYRNKYWDFDGLTEKAVCSYVRHNLTNYNQILDTLKGKVGMGVLYEQVKLYLCTRIIRLYELDIDPEYAATGDPDANENDLSKLEELENRIFASLGTQGT